MAASISAVAAICARNPSITQGQNTSGGRGSPCPSASITPTRNNSANGKPNRNRTCVAPTVPSLAVSSRCVAVRTVCAAAAISVNTTHSQPVSPIPSFLPATRRPQSSMPRLHASVISRMGGFRFWRKRGMMGRQQGMIMSESRRIGFVGMGNMGVPMAANLMRAGHQVMAYDIAAERAQRFAQAHAARASERLAELAAHAEIVITMLPTGREVRHALLEAQGGALVAGLRAGAIVIDMSSADPVGTRALGRELAARGIPLVDAPVSGGIIGAKDGTLAIMIGGEPAAVAAAKPVLAALGTKLFEVGGIGCGHAMKALNNFLAATSSAAGAEAITVGRQFGLDPAVMTEVLNASTGKSFNTENLIKQHVLSGKFATGFALGLLAKDVAIAAELARQIGVDAPIGRMVSQLWSEARDALGGEQDHSRAWAHWQTLRAPK